jgi:fatty acid desaturase/2-polyprenyl-3-methyl-5-hydroxy-6-metoxy-1,4-benzoquinol methylase
MSQVLEDDVLTTEEIRLYRQPAAWREAMDFGLVWVQILAGVALFAWSPGILTYVVAALLIAGGQHGLGLVAHEFIHYNVVPGNRRLNDFLGTWFFAAPGGLPFTLFRHRHFLHHRHYSTDLDTKTSYRRDIRGMRLWLEVLKKLTMFEYFSHVFAVLRHMRKESKAPAASGPSLIAVLPPVIVAQAAIFAALYPIHPLAYFFLWLAPLLTLQMLFLNFRAITEHQPPLALGGDLKSPYFLGTRDAFVRTVGTNLFDRLFLCKINFGYHVEHHLWPQINYQFLPAVHRKLVERKLFSNPKFGLESSFSGNILKLARQPGEDSSWYARPLSHGIPKDEVPRCPICDSPRKRFLYNVEEHEYDNTTDDRFNMMECAECSAWYLDPRPADTELGTIYPPNYYSNVLEASSAIHVEEAKKGLFHHLSLWMFKQRIRPIERHLKIIPSTRWLDIGCGFGMALESMHQVHGIRGVGVDMSARAVSICRDRGFEAYAVKIEDFEPAAGTKFHFIHSSHLIEHVGSPLAYLQKVYDLLEPGGITVFITPNTRTWESRVLGRHWGGLHVPRHWVLFNASSAARAAERAGFEHLETCYSTNSQFWVWSFHSLLLRFFPRGLCDALFPSDHRFVKSGLWMVLRGGFFTALDTLNVMCTGRSSNMAVILRKPTTSD